MRDALALIQEAAPDLAVEGEMHGDAALSKRILDRVFPDSGLASEANLLMMPNLDAGNIAYNLLRVGAGGGVTVGPILLGAAKSAHILTQTATVRGILNMTALAAVDAAQTSARAMTRIAAE
jgi:malate dehydrogenase (oxaloacetate-decarboxylating)(NADP+)